MGQKQFLGEFEELILLAILKLGESQAYGIPIAEAIEEATEKRVSTGALYTALGRLEDKEFISSQIGEKTEERGGRAKKYFRVEIGGREALRNSQAARISLMNIENLILA